MVGDSSHSGGGGQFRDVVSRDPGGRGTTVAHPDGELLLFKIEPVTFQGFYPAAVSKDPDGVHAGQHVTVVGYRRIRSTNAPSTPREAYGAQVTVREQWGRGFFSHVPGLGAYGGLPLSSCLFLETCQMFAHARALYATCVVWQRTAACRLWMIPSRSSASSPRAEEVRLKSRAF
jgi:hypothetical protein